MMYLDTKEIRAALPCLHAGDEVMLSGEVFTARDAAHKKINELLDRSGELPFPIRDSAIYYAGPTPAKNGLAVGACGPTTSSRMDVFAPRLISLGLVCMIGKGQRSEEVNLAMRKYGAVYLCAIGGAGALASKCISSADVIAFPELGCESVKRLIFKNFPLIVGTDSHGGSLFDRKDGAR